MAGIIEREAVLNAVGDSLFFIMGRYDDRNEREGQPVTRDRAVPSAREQAQHARIAEIGVGERDERAPEYPVHHVLQDALPTAAQRPPNPLITIRMVFKKMRQSRAIDICLM